MNKIYASVGQDDAFLFTQWGEDLARYLFGDFIDTLPRFIRGKHVGKIKGRIVFERVTRGGWVRDLSGCGGHVERRVGRIIRAHIETCEWRAPGKVLKSWELAR